MPFFALLAGTSGYYLRLLELWSVFEVQPSGSPLPRTGAGITYTLILVTVVFLLLVFLFAYNARRRHASPPGFQNAFGTEPLTYPFIFLAAGLAWLGATVKYFIDLNALGAIPLPEIFFSALSALSAISIALFAVEMYQDPRRKSTLALSIIPTIFMCFWLIMFYSRNSSNPVLLSYCYQCLAIVSSTLGFYFTSGYIYNKPAPGRTIFAYLAAIYFCFVTLADNHSISIKMIFITLIVINVVNSSMLIRRMQKRAS